MDPAILATLPEETHQVVEENFVQALLKHQQDARAIIRRNKPKETGNERTPRDSNLGAAQYHYRCNFCGTTLDDTSRDGLQTLLQTRFAKVVDVG